MKYCCHIGLSRPNCSSIICCWSAFRFSLMKAASGVPGISRNMKNRIVVTASIATALWVKRSRTSLMSSSPPTKWREREGPARSAGGWGGLLVVLSAAKDLIAACNRHEILRFAQDDSVVFCGHHLTYPLLRNGPPPLPP